MVFGLGPHCQEIVESGREKFPERPPCRNAHLVSISRYESQEGKHDEAELEAYRNSDPFCLKAKLMEVRIISHYVGGLGY